MNRVKPYTPIQYVMGRTQFCGLDFLVSEDVLIPRPETEMLVDTVLEVIKGARRKGKGLSILDLGTGAGNIAITLTKSSENCKIIASDISEKALEVARKNAILNKISGRVEFIKSDLFNDIEGEFDIIVSNPPYVSRPEFNTLQKEVLMEPRIAIDGGEDGLDFYRKIISAAPRHIKDGGYLIFEIGYGQKTAITEILKDASFDIFKMKKDFNRIDRVVVARWTS